MIGALVPSRSVSGLARRIEDITDGSANTVLVGEKFVDADGAYNPNYQRMGGLYGVCNDDQGWVDGWDNDTICFANGFNGQKGPVEVPKRIAKGEDSCGFNFGSIHESLLTVFCDGSVHAINFSVSPACGRGCAKLTMGSRRVSKIDDFQVYASRFVTGCGSQKQNDLRQPNPDGGSLQ